MEIKYYPLLALVFILTISCTRGPTEKTMPDIGIPSSEMNSKVQLLAPDGWNKFKTEDNVMLAVKGISSDQVLFKSDYGARLFILQDNNWKEISNGVDYSDGNIVLYPFENNYLNYGSVVLRPRLPDSTKPVTVRIILVGNIYRNGQMTNEVTAGYIDVNLKP